MPKTTTTYYQTDELGIFTSPIETTMFDPIPNGTTVAPPETSGDEVACWHMGRWEVLPEYPKPSQMVATVPQQVSMRQARLALLNTDLLDDVETVIAAAGRAAQIEWEYAATVDRSHPVIAIVQQQQDMTDSQIDALFTSAAAL